MADPEVALVRLDRIRSESSLYHVELKPNIGCFIILIPPCLLTSALMLVRVGERFFKCVVQISTNKLSSKSKHPHNLFGIFSWFMIDKVLIEEERREEEPNICSMGMRMCYSATYVNCPDNRSIAKGCASSSFMANLEFTSTMHSNVSITSSNFISSCHSFFEITGIIIRLTPVINLLRILYQYVVATMLNHDQEIKLFEHIELETAIVDLSFIADQDRFHNPQIDHLFSITNFYKDVFINVFRPQQTKLMHDIDMSMIVEYLELVNLSLTWSHLSHHHKLLSTKASKPIKLVHSLFLHNCSSVDKANAKSISQILFKYHENRISKFEMKKERKKERRAEDRID